jgi:anti-sigma B factor antagonist
VTATASTIPRHHSAVHFSRGPILIRLPLRVVRAAESLCHRRRLRGGIRACEGAGAGGLDHWRCSGQHTALGSRRERCRLFTREIPMQMDVKEDGAITIFSPLEKRLDAHVAPAFRNALITQIDAGRRQIAVNLANVEFMDSSALGALVSALKRIGADGELKVYAPMAGVRSMFELTRLHRVIPILDSELETLRAFGR